MTVNVCENYGDYMLSIECNFNAENESECKEAENFIFTFIDRKEDIEEDKNDR